MIGRSPREAAFLLLPAFLVLSPLFLAVCDIMEVVRVSLSSLIRDSPLWPYPAWTPTCDFQNMDIVRVLLFTTLPRPVPTDRAALLCV